MMGRRRTVQRYPFIDSVELINRRHAAGHHPRIGMGSITAYHPTLAERIGQGFGRVVGRLVGDSEREQVWLGDRTTNFLRDFTPVGNVDDFLYGNKIERSLAVFPLPGLARPGVVRRPWPSV